MQSAYEILCMHAQGIYLHTLLFCGNSICAISKHVVSMKCFLCMFQVSISSIKGGH